MASPAADPPPVAGDADRHDVVAVAVGGREHVSGRDARHLVLGRPRRRTARPGGCARPGSPGERSADCQRWRRCSCPPSDVGRRRRRAPRTATTSRSTAWPSTPARSSAASCSCPSSPSATATTSSPPPSSRRRRACVLTQQRIADGVAAIAVGRHRAPPCSTSAGSPAAAWPDRSSASPARSARPRPRTSPPPPWPAATARRPASRVFNNELGVPLTLANAPDGTEAAVVEMGARARGHIALLCDVARPTIGVVTAVVARPHRDVRLDRRGRGGQGRAGRGPARRRHGRAQRRRPAGGGDGRRARRPGCCALARAVDRRRRRRRAPRARRRAAAAVHACARRGATPRCASPVRGEHQVANALAAAGAALACGRRARRRWPPASATPCCRRGGWTCARTASGARRPQRRLQRQPDVDGGRAAVAGRAPGPPPHRRARDHGRARRPPRRRARRHRRPRRRPRHRRRRRTRPTPTGCRPFGPRRRPGHARRRSATATPCS